MVAVADYAWMDGALQFAPSQSLSPALRPALRPRARHLLPCHYTSPTARRERDSERERERERASSFPFAAAAAAAAVETSPSGTANPVMYDRPTAVVARDLEAGRP